MNYIPESDSERSDLENLKKICKKNPSKNVIKYWELKLIGSKKEERRYRGTLRNIDQQCPVPSKGKC